MASNNLQRAERRSCELYVPLGEPRRQVLREKYLPKLAALRRSMYVHVTLSYVLSIQIFTQSTQLKIELAQCSMACLIAPIAAVLIVNRRESKDKIMVRLLLNVICRLAPFAMGGIKLKQSLFACPNLFWIRHVFLLFIICS